MMPSQSQPAPCLGEGLLGEDGSNTVHACGALPFTKCFTSSFLALTTAWGGRPGRQHYPCSTEEETKAHTGRWGDAWMKTFATGSPWGPVSTDLVSLPLGAPTSFQILVTFLFGLSSSSYGSETKQSPNPGERATFGKEGRTMFSVWAMLSVRCL